MPASSSPFDLQHLTDSRVKPSAKLYNPVGATGFDDEELQVRYVFLTGTVYEPSMSSLISLKPSDRLNLELVLDTHKISLILPESEVN